MRAVYVLVAILSFVAPQMSWGAIEQSLSSSGAIVLSAPASGASQISRAVSKVDKIFGGGIVITEFVALFPAIGSLDSIAAETCDVPHLDLEGPPLAPRPPPL